MFLQASVILSTGGGGLPHCMLGYPPRTRPPQEQTPPGPDTPREQTPPGPDTPPDQTPPGEQTPPGPDTPPGADTSAGTHPTGMHSCLKNISNDEVDQSALIKFLAMHYYQFH